MSRLLLALLLSAVGIGTALGEPQQVTIHAPDVELQAVYALPDGPAKAPAIVALHGCAGPYPARDNQWRDLFVQAGQPVLLPDSYRSRGLGQQCRVRNRGISPAGKRRSDTVAAAKWLAQQPGTPTGGIVVLGWSSGGSTALAAATPGVMPPGLVRGFVTFYPGCRVVADRPEWAPSAPMLIVMGTDDDWTPAAPCKDLAARFPDRIKLVLIPGAYHDFDAPNRPVTIRRNLAFTANNDGAAHAGTNDAGRALALKLVPEWIAGLVPLR